MVDGSLLLIGIDFVFKTFDFQDSYRILYTDGTVAAILTNGCVSFTFPV